MSLDAILNAILASGEEQVRQIEIAAERQVVEVKSQARREAEQIRTEARAAALAPAAQDRSRLLHQARLEAMRLIGNEREELINVAFEQARQRLAQARSDRRYPMVSIRLAEEALAGLGNAAETQANVVLEADSRDQAWLQEAFAGRKVTLRFDLHCWGGAIARSADGRVVVINTLEARLERATPLLRRYLAALFEQTLAVEREPSLV